MLFPKSTVSALVVAAVAALGAAATSGEEHTVEFVNNCGKGTPQPQRNGKILSNSEPYTQHGGRLVATAWLQTDDCDAENGGNCTLILLDLENGSESDNANSSTEIYTVSPQYKFSDPVKFEYFGPCNGGNEWSTLQRQRS
ncbi:hypothetical protein FRC10_000485 [Ceratobasidium sp. 414]|nr:hypothetical protein FRC10_000485 [Ceratobasidium sp. 414]